MSSRIAVVDTSVQNHADLIAGLPSDVQVLLIDGSSGDGWQQLASRLSGYSDIGELHLFSHGAQGSVQLGGQTLNTTTLADQAAVLADIGSHLAEGADVLLYGCSVGAGEEGRSFVNQFAAAVGADVAASDDLTGAAGLGGDWVLEVNAGKVEAAGIEVAGYVDVLPNASPVNSSNALNFDGVDDYVTVSGIAGLPVGNQSYSIEAWIKAESVGARGIIGWGTYVNNQANAVRLDTDGGVFNYWFLTCSQPQTRRLRC